MEQYPDFGMRVGVKELVAHPIYNVHFFVWLMPYQGEFINAFSPQLRRIVGLKSSIEPASSNLREHPTRKSPPATWLYIGQTSKDYGILEYPLQPILDELVPLEDQKVVIQKDLLKDLAKVALFREKMEENKRMEEIEATMDNL